MQKICQKNREKNSSSIPPGQQFTDFSNSKRKKSYIKQTFFRSKIKKEEKNSKKINKKSKKFKKSKKDTEMYNKEDC